MNAGRTRRAISCATLIVATLLCSSNSGSASSITLKWADSFDDKPVFIEGGGGDRLFDGKLAGEDLVIETDTLLGDTGSNIAAMVNVEGLDDLAVGINLFKCAAQCKWRIVFSELVESNSKSVNKICQANPTSLDGQFRKYFFCRRAFRVAVGADGSCWRQARAALTGWFDAAYRLHELTLRGGIGFIARDTEVEELIKDSLQACSDFEASVGRRKGYFNGMVQNLNVAILQQTQRVERSLVAENVEEARGLAEKIVEQLDVVTVRDAIPARDARYVEDILNRSLAPNRSFTLR